MNNKIITEVLFRAFEEGDQNEKDWAFYENTDGLHNWTKSDALAERARFINTVIKQYYEEVRK